MQSIWNWSKHFGWQKTLIIINIIFRYVWRGIKLIYFFSLKTSYGVMNLKNTPSPAHSRTLWIWSDFVYFVSRIVILNECSFTMIASYGSNATISIMSNNLWTTVRSHIIFVFIGLYILGKLLQVNAAIVQSACSVCAAIVCTYELLCCSAHCCTHSHAYFINFIRLPHMHIHS